MDSEKLVGALKKAIIPGLAAMMYLYDQYYSIPYPGANNPFFLLGLLGWCTLLLVIPSTLAGRIEATVFAVFLAIIVVFVGRNVIDGFYSYLLFYVSGGFFLVSTPIFLLSWLKSES